MCLTFAVLPCHRARCNFRFDRSIDSLTIFLKKQHIQGLVIILFDHFFILTIRHLTVTIDNPRRFITTFTTAQIKKIETITQKNISMRKHPPPRKNKCKYSSTNVPVITSDLVSRQESVVFSNENIYTIFEWPGNERILASRCLAKKEVELVLLEPKRRLMMHEDKKSLYIVPLRYTMYVPLSSMVRARSCIPAFYFAGACDVLYVAIGESGLFCVCVFAGKTFEFNRRKVLTFMTIRNTFRE